MKDDRLYAKFTLDFADSPKMITVSDGAFRTFVAAVLYSRRHNLDGCLSRDMALAIWLPSHLSELCHNHPERPSLIEHEWGWEIRDYAEHQVTSSDVEKRREMKASAGRKGAEARWHLPPETDGKPIAPAIEKNSRSMAEIEIEKEEGGYVSGVRHLPVKNGLTDGPPPKFCPKHMPSGTLDACAACGDYRRRHIEWMATRSAEASEAARAQRHADTQVRVCDIEACPMCNDDGYQPNGRVCDHIDRTETNEQGIAKVRTALNAKKAKTGEGAE